MDYMSYVMNNTGTDNDFVAISRDGLAKLSPAARRVHIAAVRLSQLLGSVIDAVDELVKQERSVSDDVKAEKGVQHIINEVWHLQTVGMYLGQHKDAIEDISPVCVRDIPEPQLNALFDEFEDEYADADCEPDAIAG